MIWSTFGAIPLNNTKRLSIFEATIRIGLESCDHTLVWEPDVPQLNEVHVRLFSVRTTVIDHVRDLLVALLVGCTTLVLRQILLWEHLEVLHGLKWKCVAVATELHLVPSLGGDVEDEVLEVNDIGKRLSWIVSETHDLALVAWSKADLEDTHTKHRLKNPAAHRLVELHVFDCNVESNLKIICKRNVITVLGADHHAGSTSCHLPAVDVQRHLKKVDRHAIRSTTIGPCSTNELTDHAKTPLTESLQLPTRVVKGSYEARYTVKLHYHASILRLRSDAAVRRARMLPSGMRSTTSVGAGVLLARA